MFCVCLTKLLMILFRWFATRTINNSDGSKLNADLNGNKEMLSISGKKKCSYCDDELGEYIPDFVCIIETCFSICIHSHFAGRGAAMIIESLRLFYHLDCFKCSVCRVQLGDGVSGADVRVRNQKLHCHNCFSSDDGIKFSCV